MHYVPVNQYNGHIDRSSTSSLHFIWFDVIELTFKLHFTNPSVMIHMTWNVLLYILYSLLFLVLLPETNIPRTSLSLYSAWRCVILQVFLLYFKFVWLFYIFIPSTTRIELSAFFSNSSMAAISNSKWPIYTGTAMHINGTCHNLNYEWDIT